MSVTKNKVTEFHESAQDVRFRLNWLRLGNLDNLKNVNVRGCLLGRVGTVDGAVDWIETNISLSDIKDHFSNAEKQAAKAFIAACERELARKVVELAGEAHDDSDVFVDNSV